MPDEPEKPKGDPRLRGGEHKAEADPPADGGEENDRPTVSPPFDPVAFARDILKPSPAPMHAVGQPRGPADPHTHATPPQGTEQLAASRQASRRSERSEPNRRKTPTSTLSLANARIPSNLPPRPGQAPKAERANEQPTGRSKGADPDHDQATRPPPPPPPNEVESSRKRASKSEPDDLNIELELAADTVRRPVPQPGQRQGAPIESRRPAEIREPARPPAVEMNARVELGDYSGALEIAEQILASDPGSISAKACAETCRSVLRQMYAARIGPLDRVPVVMVPRDQLRWLSIDHKAGFVLSLVDGVSSLEMIIDVSGMPELDTLRILSELAQQRIISLR